MGNRRSFLRHVFEGQNGIKYTKLEAYGNWFPCLWMRIRKHGLKLAVEYLGSRIWGAPKSTRFEDFGEKDKIWSRQNSRSCWCI